MTDYLDTAAVAHLLGVQPSTVTRYRHRPTEQFPAPDIVLGGRPGWRPKTIRTWMQHRPGQGAGGGTASQDRRDSMSEARTHNEQNKVYEPEPAEVRWQVLDPDGNVVHSGTGPVVDGLLVLGDSVLGDVNGEIRMNDLVAFLRARLDEAAAAAKRGQEIRTLLNDRHRDITLDVRNGAEFVWQKIDYDPARALREVEAKRRIVDEFQVIGTNLLSDARFVLRMMATVYDDHPDYREEWRP